MLRKDKSSGSSFMNGLDGSVPAIPLVNRSNSSSIVGSRCEWIFDFSRIDTGREYCRSRGLFTVHRTRQQSACVMILEKFVAFDTMHEGAHT